MMALLIESQQTWTSLSEIGGNLFRLLQTYIGHAWPFALAHLALLLFIYFDSIRVIRAELRSLRSWRPGEEGATEGTQMLSHFVRETKSWGTQGVLVPMTDYSDRLDSHIDHLFDNLHSRINLFLIIGIAGTFFAMFQFAIGAPSALDGSAAASGLEAGRSLARLLVQALGQAFPVGFFGLFLTIVGHVLAYREESHLRSAAWQATQLAMRTRLECAAGPAQAIREALQPLERLDDTLKDRLQPLIESFEEQLKSAASLIQSQFQPLAVAVASFGRKVDELIAPISTFADVCSQLPAALRKIAELQRQTREQFAGISKDLAALREALASSAGELQKGAAQLTGIGENLRTSFAESLARMREEAASLWQDASREFLAKIQPPLAVLEGSATALTSAASTLEGTPAAVREAVNSSLAQMAEEAARTLVQAAERFHSHLEEQGRKLTVLGDLAERHVSQLESLRVQAASNFSQGMRQLADQSAQIWQQSSENAMRDLQNDLLDRLDRLRDGIEKTCDKIGAASDELAQVAQNARAILTNALKELLETAIASLQPQLHELRRTIQEYYPRILENFTTGVRESSELAANARAMGEEIKTVSVSLAGAKAQWAGLNLELDRTIRMLRGNDGASPRTPPPCEAARLASHLSGISDGLEKLRRDVSNQPKWLQWLRGKRKG
jgi:ABC-type transporter Mla subunit MlaD